MERGTLAVGACLWMTAVVGGALAAAYVGVRVDLAWPKRGAALAAVLATTLVAAALAHRVRRGFDTTELRRGSLPPAAARQLAALPGSITLDVYLDRDDARRRQLESDVLAKLRLARPDLEVRMPTDEQADATEAGRDEGYGRVVVHAGGGTRETRSTSRREIVSLIFEAAGYQLPDWSQPEYPGYPLVIAGGRRRALVVSAYLGIPLAPLVVGWILTRSKGRS